MKTKSFSYFRTRVNSVLRHPNFLLPGAPKYLVPNTRAHLDTLGLFNAGADFIDGPELAIFDSNPPELLKLSEVKGSEYVHPKGQLRVAAATSVVYIQNGSILGPQGWLMNQSGGLFQDLVHSDRKGPSYSNSLFKRRRFPSKQSLGGCYATLCYPYSANWYHWFIQSLPRLRLIENNLDAIDGVFIPDSPHHQRMVESLKFFGVDQSRIIVLGSQHFAVDALLVPQYFAQSNVPTWVPQYFRSKVEKVNQSGAGELIYISRSDAVNRICTNESAVLDAIEPLGFKSYCLAEMSFQSQADLFANAAVVIGAHGAGLSNIAFCRAGTCVIEVFPSADVHSDLFHNIASAAHLEYYRIEAHPDGENPDIHSSFTIPISSLTRLISQFL